MEVTHTPQCHLSPLLLRSCLQNKKRTDCCTNLWDRKISCFFFFPTDSPPQKTGQLNLEKEQDNLKGWFSNFYSDLKKKKLKIKYNFPKRASYLLHQDSIIPSIIPANECVHPTVLHVTHSVKPRV